MIEELDMHILDLVQNAIAADANRISVEIRCIDDQLILRVSDDGKGMTPEVRAAVERGFFSTKSPKAVGLGIPLLKETAEQCDGSFSLETAPGQGTTVTATFRRSHIDLPPFGNLAATILDLLVMCEGRDLEVSYHCDGHDLELSTRELAGLLGGVRISHPAVIKFLQDYLTERIGGNVR